MSRKKKHEEAMFRGLQISLLKDSFQFREKDLGGTRRESDQPGYINDIIEWLPDWRDESQYPDPKSTLPAEWAWQFLRRNKRYQEAYRDILRFDRKLKDFCNQGRVPSLPSSDEAENRWERIIDSDPASRLLNRAHGGAPYEFQRKFLINGLVNPANKKAGGFLGQVIVRGMGVTSSEILGLVNSEFLARINIDFPIKPQLDIIQSHIDFVKKQTSHKRENGKAEGSRALFVKYLRLLDIQDSEGSQDDMLDIIGDRTYNGKYTVLKVWLPAAERMRDRGYKALLIS